MPGYQGSVLDGDTVSDGTGGAGGSSVQRNTPQGKLPRENDVLMVPWSLERDTQFREVLGSGFAATVGQGFITGDVVQTGDLTVALLAGARFYCGGVIFRLLEDAVFNQVPSSGTTVFWVNLVRTPPADHTAARTLDNYGLEVAGGLDRPTPTHVPVCVITSASGAITGIDANPSQKWLRKRVVTVFTNLGVGDAGEVAVDHSAYFRRYEVGHTRVLSVDQDGVTATVKQETVTETGFSISLESSGEPSVDLYGSDTQLEIVVECWGGFTDAA